MVLAHENLTTDKPSTDEFGANDWLIDEMYQAYQSDPNSVDDRWQQFFAERATNGSDEARAAVSDDAWEAPAAPAAATESAAPAPAAKPEPAPEPAQSSPAAPSAEAAPSSADPKPPATAPHDSYTVVAERAITILQGFPSRAEVTQMVVSVALSGRPRRGHSRLATASPWML